MASIRDVAKLAKVSKSTVSLVINNTGYVSEDTRARVEKAIAELEYKPSRIAQGLSTNRSGLIAVVVPDVAHPYFSTLVKSIEQKLAAQEYMTIVCSAKENESIEKWYLEMLNHKIVDGIITAGHTIDLDEYKKSSRPIVSIDRNISESIPIVQADHRAAASAACELLVNAKCRKVAQFVGTPDISVQSDLFNQCLAKMLLEKGIEVVPISIGYNTFHISEYEECVKKSFDIIKRVDALVGVDAVILASYKLAVHAGIQVPQQLKMIAYDGTYLTRLHTPVITSIVQPIEKIGECAAELIVQIIKGQPVQQKQYMLPVSVQSGETC